MSTQETLLVASLPTNQPLRSAFPYESVPTGGQPRNVNVLVGQAPVVFVSELTDSPIAWRWRTCPRCRSLPGRAGLCLLWVAKLPGGGIYSHSRTNIAVDLYSGYGYSPAATLSYLSLSPASIDLLYGCSRGGELLGRSSPCSLRPQLGCWTKSYTGTHISTFKVHASILPCRTCTFSPLSIV